MKEVKPIALIYIPYEDFWGPYTTPAKMMNLFNGWDDKVLLSKSFEDYLWFVFVKPSIETPEFQVFHPKGFTEIQYKELKDMVVRHIESQNNNQ